MTTSQPQIAPSIPQPASYGQTVQATAPEKRQRKPLAIVDPVSHKPVEVSSQSASSSAQPTTATTTTSSSSSSTVSSTITTSDNRSSETTTTDSSISSTKVANDTNKTQKQAEFRRQFAEILVDSSSAQTDKV